MIISPEQAEQAHAIILDCLNVRHKHRVPFQQVWSKPTEDFDGYPFVEAWVIYGGDPRGLDPDLLNSFNTYVADSLRQAGILVLPSISYVHESEVDQLGTPWIG